MTTAAPRRSVEALERVSLASERKHEAGDEYREAIRYAHFAEGHSFAAIGRDAGITRHAAREIARTAEAARQAEAEHEQSSAATAA